jgi:outer membrane protein TolC
MATAGCLSTTARTMLREAEGVPEVASHLAADARPSGVVASAKGAATPAPTEADLAAPIDRATVTAAVLARHPALVAAAHRVRELAEKARAEASLPAPELMAEIWQVPLAQPYRIDMAGMTMFTLKQELPPAGALSLASEAMALEARSAAAMVVAEARGIVRDVDRAFADYAAAAGREAVQRRALVLAERMGEAARARYATGAPLADVTKAEVEVARMRIELEREAGMAADARARLNVLLGRRADAALGAPRDTPAEAPAEGPDELATRAAAASPEVEAAELMQKSASTSAEAAKREATVPKFMLGVSGFLPNEAMGAAWGASFGMSLPWVWGGAKGKARAAEERAHAEAASADAARLRVRTEIGRALAEARSAERRMLLLRDVARPAAERALEAAEAGYATRGTDVLMFIDALRSSLAVDMDLVDARADLDRALADLDGATASRVARKPLPAPTEPDRHE